MALFTVVSAVLPDDIDTIKCSPEERCERLKKRVRELEKENVDLKMQLNNLHLEHSALQEQYHKQLEVDDIVGQCINNMSCHFDNNKHNS